MREVKVVTNGFAPEFGQTTGMVYNAITPVGHQRPARIGELPLQAQLDVGAAVLPGADRAQARHQGRRRHGDARRTDRAGPARTSSARTSTSTAASSRAARSSRSRRRTPPRSASRCRRAASFRRTRRCNFALRQGRLPGRPAARSSPAAISCSRTSRSSNIGGGLTTTDRATDFTDRMDSAVGAGGHDDGHEPAERVPRPVRPAPPVPHASAPASAGPAITVSGVAQFGGPRIGDGNSVGFDFNQKIWQVIDNYTWIAGAHALKGGIDAAVHRRRSRRRARTSSTPSRRSTRTSPRRAARTRSATPSLQQTFGDARRSSYNSTLLRLLRAGRLADRAAHQAALRRALRPVRRAAERRPFAANPYSNELRRSTRTTSARAPASRGRSTTTGRTVLRASTGKMFEPPLIDFYDNAILNNGDPLRYNVSVAGIGVGRAAVPDQPRRRLPRRLHAAAAEHHRGRPRLQDAVGVAEQRPARARARTATCRVAVGYVNAIGRNLPVLIDVNLIPTGATLADGRPIYSTTVSAATRVDPTFDHINVFKSIGESTYNAFTATLTQAHEERLAGAGDLHAGARHRQRAADRHLRRRQRRRSRVRSVEPRSRQGRDAVQPDPHAGRSRRCSRRR